MSNKGGVLENLNYNYDLINGISGVESMWEVHLSLKMMRQREIFFSAVDIGLKFAALILASSQPAGASYDLVQPILTATTLSYLKTARKLSCVLSSIHS